MSRSTCARTFPYVPIARFGASVNPVMSIDPVAASIYRDVDSSFDIGETAVRYGPRAKESMLYMAQRCAANWDGACEFLSRNEDTAGVCNQAKVVSPLFPRINPPGSQSIGDILVENAATQRFCDLSSCSIRSEPYDPTNPRSVMVNQYGCCGTQTCLPMCMPPTDPDNDLLLNKLLDKPQLHLDLLLNMYRNANARNLRAAYASTRIGRVFAIFDLYPSAKQSPPTNRW